MQVKNHLFLRRDDNREAERARVTFAISLALSTIADLLSSVVHVRFTNGEAWVRFSIHFDLRFDFFDFKIGSLANKSCTLISWRSRFYLSFLWFDVRRSNKFVENSINLATKKYLSYLSLHKGHLSRRGTGLHQKNWLRLRSSHFYRTLSLSISLFLCLIADLIAKELKQ